MVMRRKRTVDKIIEESYWDGFFEGLGNGSEYGLGFASDSGLYQYNEVSQIAHQAGYEYAKQVLAERAERVAGKRGLHFFTINRKVPGGVYAECYGAARIATRRRER